MHHRLKHSVQWTWPLGRRTGAEGQSQSVLGTVRSSKSHVPRWHLSTWALAGRPAELTSSTPTSIPSGAPTGHPGQGSHEGQSPRKEGTEGEGEEPSAPLREALRAAGSQRSCAPSPLGCCEPGDGCSNHLCVASALNLQSRLSRNSQPSVLTPFLKQLLHCAPKPQARHLGASGGPQLPSSPGTASHPSCSRTPVQAAPAQKVWLGRWK